MLTIKTPIFYVLIIASSLSCDNVGSELGDAKAMAVIDIAANSITYTTPKNTQFALIKNPDVTTISYFPISTTDGTLVQCPSNYLIADSEISFILYKEVRNWTALSGLGYDLTNNGFAGAQNLPTTNDNHPVTGIYWSDSIVWCNALTEYINANNGDEPDIDCVYYQDANYTVPLRNAFFDNKQISPGSLLKPYIKALTPGNTDMANCTALGFRLPTSTEWEFAARYRGSNQTNAILVTNIYYTKGDSASGARSSFIDEAETILFAVFTQGFSDPESTQPIKSKRSNTMGLYDMSGNASEWCFDEVETSEGKLTHHLRGGSWKSNAVYVQIGYITSKEYNDADSTCGFRIARNIR